MDDAGDVRARKARTFALKRLNRTLQQARRTPRERVDAADALRSLWRPEHVGGSIRTSDESIELWRAIRARLRGLP